MRVLHLISSSGFFGAEQVIINLAARSRGIDSWVGALHNRHNPHLEIIIKAQEKKLSTIVFESRGQFDIGTIRTVKKFLLHNHIDIVHTHNYKADIIGFCATCGTQVQWVATNHGWLGTDARLRLYETIDAFVLKFARKVVGVSETIKENLLKKNVPLQRLAVVPNGIDIAEFHQPVVPPGLRASLNLAPNDFVVLIAGRLAIEKGHRTFLKAAAIVGPKIPQAKFLIVGDGPLRKELEQDAKDLQLASRVIFAGIRRDMPSMYKISDCLVNASSIEGLPMTILEAMAAHLPVIATPVGAVPQVVRDHQNGFLYPPGDEQALASALLALIQDPALRQRVAIQAYQDVQQQFSDGRMAEHYQKIYGQILAA